MARISNAPTRKVTHQHSRKLARVADTPHRARGGVATSALLMRQFTPVSLIASAPSRPSLAFCKTCSTACSMSFNSACSAPARAMKIKSQPWAMFSRRCRTTSRINRLARLRATAFPIFFPTTNPKRLVSIPLGHARRMISGCDQDLPASQTR